ncbi:hypothetical protein GCM10027266_08920 [Arenimonas alkanexedens]
MAGVIAFAWPSPAPASDIAQLTQRCDAGDRPACASAGLMLSDPAQPGFDIFLSLRFLQQACLAREAAACGRLSLIYAEGSDDVEADWSMAGNFAQQACVKQDRTGCEVAEVIYSDPASPEFDAEKSLRYRRVNCDFGRWTSCLDLARIFYNLEDVLPAEQVAQKACGNGAAERKTACDFASTLRQRREQNERAIAQQRQAAAARMQATERASEIVRSFLAQGEYDSAIYTAIYHSKSADDAALALEATYRAGQMASIFKDNLYVLDYWFPTGQLNQIINAELSGRSRANDCGIFNCTNMPGASTGRWQAAGGGGTGYRPAASGGSSSSPRMKSSAEISQETRSRYRYAHCTMGGGNSNLCR